MLHLFGVHRIFRACANFRATDRVARFSRRSSHTVRLSSRLVPIARSSRLRQSRARKNSAEAQKQNAAAMTAVLQKIEQAGVPKDAIRTIGYELHPEFDYANGRQTFRTYLARNTVEVRLDDIDRVGVVIDAAGCRWRDDD